MNNKEQGFIAIPILLLMMIVFSIWVPLETRGFYLNKIVDDEKEFVKLEYECERGLLWISEKSKEEKIENMSRKIELKENDDIAVSVQILNYLNIEGKKTWKIRSKAINLKNKYNTKKEIELRYLNDKAKPYKCEIRYIKDR